MPEAGSPKVCGRPDVQEVRNAIVRHISDSDITFSKWCVGVAADPRTRLFIDLNVGKDVPWIFKDTGSEESAMAVREFIVDTYGTRGSAWNGGGIARYVYAYAVTDGSGRERARENRG